MSTESAKTPSAKTEGAPVTAGASVAKKTSGSKTGGTAKTEHRRERPLRLRINSWMRWLHTYISMFCLLVILFFAVTGITLNHPEWAINSQESTTELSGTLPSGWKKGAEADWFVVSEHLRKANGVRGLVTDKRFDDVEGSITFKGPGYSADCFFEPDSGKYKLTIVGQGLVGKMNDFHRGQNSGEAWSWVIDLSGILLTVIALTGLGLLFYLKKIRTPGLIVMGLGSVITIVLMYLAM